MEFLQSLKSNSIVLILLPIILALIAKFVRREKIMKAVQAEWIGVVIETFLLRFFPANSYEKFIEGWVITALDAGIEFIKSVKRGVLRNNVKRLAKKKVDPDIMKAFNEALEE